MTSGEERSLTWIIPGLMTATLSLVGWMAININRMSENLAVVVYRVEAESTYTKDLNNRLRNLEIFAALKGKQFESSP